MTLEELCDREAIRDVIYKYCHAIDRRDPDLLRTVYWPEAVDDHSMINAGVEGFVAAAMDIVGACVVTQHSVGNILIHLEGDSARVETYINAYQRMEGAERLWRLKPGPVPESGRGKFTDFFTGSRYLDHMEKRGGIWRIRNRKLMQDWYRVTESHGWDNYPYGGERALGTHDHSDPGYRLFEDVKWP
jgi:SnoaL-like domain